VSAHWGQFVDLYGLTKSEAKIFMLLLDGEPHTTDQCITDGLGKISTNTNVVGTMIWRIRPKIAPHGYTILSSQGKSSTGYRMVRHAV